MPRLTKLQFEGFYYASGTPVYPDGLALGTGAFTSAMWREDTSPLLIIHFHLASLPDEGSAARVAHQNFLASFFVPGGLGVKHHELMYMDISLSLPSGCRNEISVDAHLALMEAHLKNIVDSKYLFSIFFTFL